MFTKMVVDIKKAEELFKFIIQSEWKNLIINNNCAYIRNDDISIKLSRIVGNRMEVNLIEYTNFIMPIPKNVESCYYENSSTEGDLLNSLFEILKFTNKNVKA